ncbi:zinc ribbon domain-containing protein [Halorussus pelagicus]|uniref:zinc ribbon domain-containing protein n=1 Tax=Halorussus pelagicus TaxID=2505977 RepID=UPI000FFBF032|nr:zinc ribbon domain-containing protein [Halorussus pelagicus]
MLFIIFGWSHRTKEYGPTYPMECPHCSNESYFHLLKYRRWFSLYFIPLIPLGFGSYDLVCPVCSSSIELDGRAEATQAKQLSSAAEDYQDGKLTTGEFDHELQAFEADVFSDVAARDIKRQPYGDGDSKIFRPLMALLFVFATIVAVQSAVSLYPGSFALGVLCMLPYLVIRYRDPESTTVPFASILKNRS